MSEAPQFRKSTAREYFESLVITVILALFGTTFIIQAFKIPTPSMENNLLVGDHLLVNKFAFGTPGSMLDAVLPLRTIERGDVIVFRYPEDLTKHYVKRVIALPGERFRLVDQEVFVNGEPVDEPYKMHIGPPGGGDPFRDHFPPQPHPGRIYSGVDGGRFWPYQDHVVGGELVVPEGHYFAMGDNRDNSSDSRYWGFVPADDIVGKALVIYWSYDADAAAYAQTSFLARIRQIGDLVVNFFGKTRWSRTFQVVR